VVNEEENGERKTCGEGKRKIIVSKGQSRAGRKVRKEKNVNEKNTLEGGVVAGARGIGPSLPFGEGDAAVVKRGTSRRLGKTKKGERKDRPKKVWGGLPFGSCLRGA